MTKKRQRKWLGLHPYDTNDYEDVPDWFVLYLIVRFRHRINGICRDVHFCTLANALTEDAARLGILELGRRGCSKRYVAMLLDPKIHPWAKEGQWYRARFDDKGAEIAAELDAYASSPTSDQQFKNSLKDIAAKSPDGDDTVYATVKITAPPPSARKGYRAKATGRGHTGTGTKRSSHVVRRHWAPAPKALQSP